MPRQTTFVKAQDITPRWHVVDMDGRILGRTATTIATVLMGKHRPEYTPHVDCGDYVVVTNARNVRLTGRKAEQKKRLTYSGYPGGLREESYGDLLERRPEVVIENAVRRMLPKNRLGRKMLKKLKVYPGTEHPHHCHRPTSLPL